MNRFRVKLGHEADFEMVWKERDTHLKDVAGFVSFNLLRGTTNDEHTLYASHTIWASKTQFEQWTKSEAFIKAHRDAGKKRDHYLMPPKFEGFEIIQAI
ncbi:MAG TPA: antibiotic biosynthesis monooxygenase [Opitutaceae bacterium]